MPSNSIWIGLSIWSKACGPPSSRCELSSWLLPICWSSWSRKHDLRNRVLGDRTQVERRYPIGGVVTVVLDVSSSRLGILASCAGVVSGITLIVMLVLFSIGVKA
jgi:hypothetical protein